MLFPSVVLHFDWRSNPPPVYWPAAFPNEGRQAADFDASHVKIAERFDPQLREILIAKTFHADLRTLVH